MTLWVLGINHQTAPVDLRERVAFDAGVKVTGITVHFANEDYDKGPIVAQRAVEVREDDTHDDLEARIHEVEHVLYPEVLRLVAEGRVTVGEDRKVHIAPAR